MDLERQDGVGAALTQGSRVWFTISHGIVNEIYYPRVDQACVRDLGLIVTDGGAFFAEVKRDCDTFVERIEDGVPAFRLTSTHRGGWFRLINQVIADPRSDSIVLKIHLEDAAKAGLRVFSLLAPHLVNGGAQNNARRDEYKGHEILCAAGHGTLLAMLGNPPFLARSVGFVGVSDGWQQLSHHRRLTEEYDTATKGNVALSAELATILLVVRISSLGKSRSRFAPSWALEMEGRPSLHSILPQPALSGPLCHADRYDPAPKRLLWRRAEKRLDVFFGRQSAVGAAIIPAFRRIEAFKAAVG